MEKKTNSKKPLGSKSLTIFKGDKKVSISKIKDVDFAKAADLAEKVVVGHARKHIGSRIKNLHEIRRSVIVWLGIMVVLVGSLLMFRSMGQKSYRERGFAEGGVYTEGVLGDISTLNPLFASSTPEKIFAEIAFSRLFDIDSSGKLNYEAVKNVSTQDNYKNFTLKLRENIIWSDGEKLTADDVIFTMEILKNKTLFPQRSQIWKNVEISKISDFELSVKTPSGTPLVLQSFDFPILPKHKFDNLSIDKIRESDFEKKPVTSGEFSYRSFSKSDNKSVIRLEKNDKFYGGVPKLDFFEIAAFTEKDTLKKSLLNGEVSGSGEFSDGEFSVQEKSKFNKTESNLNKGIFAFFNNSSEILKEKTLRRALAEGIDMSKVREKLSGVSSLNYPIFEEFFNSNESPKIEYNQVEAEKKLDQLGWIKSGNNRQKDGKKLKLNISSTNNKNLESAASEIKNQLSQIGVEAILTIADKDDKTGAYIQSVVQARSYDILLFEVDLGADADIYPFWHSSQATLEGLNFSNYKDFVADDILFNYRNSVDENAKKSRMTAFVNRWLQESPAMPVARLKSTYFSRSSVNAYSSKNKLVNQFNKYTDVKYWQVNAKNLYKTP